MPPELRPGKARGRERETWIEAPRLPIEAGRAVEGFGIRVALAASLLKLSLQKEIVSFWIASRRSGYGFRLAHGELGLQGVGDLLRNFTLNREEVSTVAVVAFPPKVCLGPRIDELN